MAKGRIEQEIALKVTGLDDVKDIDKRIETLTKKKAKIELDVDDKGAAKKIRAIDDELDQLKSRKAEVTVTANVDKALAGTKEVLDNVHKMDGETAAVVLGIKAAEIERTLSEVRAELAQIDGEQVDVELRATQAQDLVQELDKVKSKIVEINDTPVTIDTRGVRKGTDDIVTGMDQANSATANMVGNASQDLGELAGVSGSAGVAVGQLAEYFTDSAIKAKGLGQGIGQIVKSFAGAALPIAGIAVAVQAAQSVMKAFADQAARTAKTEAFNVDNAKIFTDAARDNLDLLTAFVDEAREQGKIEVAPDAAQQTAALKLLAQEGETLYDTIQRINEGGGPDFDMRHADEEVIDVTDLLDRAKQSADDFINAASNPAAFEQFVANVKNSNLPLAEQEQLLAAALYQHDQYATGVADSEQDLRVFGKTQEDVNKIIEQTDPAIEAVQQAYKDGAAAAKQMAEDQLALEESLRDTNDELDEAALAAEGFTSALDKIDASSDLDFSLMAINTVKSFDNIKESLEEAQKAGVDWSKVDLVPTSVEQLKGISPQMEAVVESVHGMRESIQAELTGAFDTGGIQGYRDKAAFFAAEIGGQFVQSFKDAGASTKEAEEKTRELLEALGLLPEQVEIQVKLSQAEAARKALEIFKTDIDRLPPIISTEIKTLWAKGDTIAALELLNRYMADHDLPPIDIDSIINPPADPPVIPPVPPVEISAVYATEADAIATMVDTAQQMVDGTPVFVPSAFYATPADGLATMIDASQQAVDGTPVVVPVDGDPAPVEEVIEDVENGDYDASVTVDGNPDPVEGVIGDVEGGDYDATVDVGGDPAPVNGVIDTVENGAYAATVTVGSNPRPVNDSIHSIENKAYQASVNVGANTSQYERDLAAATKPRTQIVNVQLKQQAVEMGGTAGPYGALAGEAGPEFAVYPDGRKVLLTGPTGVPPGTKVTSTRRTRQILLRGGGGDVPRLAAGGTAPAAPSTLVVNNITNVNAAVVGSRYDVARAVGQGNRDLVRLLGRRGTGVR